MEIKTVAFLWQTLVSDVQPSGLVLQHSWTYCILLGQGGSEEGTEPCLLTFSSKYARLPSCSSFPEQRAKGRWEKVGESRQLKFLPRTQEARKIKNPPTPPEEGPQPTLAGLLPGSNAATDKVLPKLTLPTPEGFPPPGPVAFSAVSAVSVCTGHLTGTGWLGFPGWFPLMTHLL